MNTPFRIDPDIEARVQIAAEALDDPADLPAEAITQYRGLYKAIRSTSMASLPPGFAARMERLTRDHAEQPDGTLRWLCLGGALLSISAAIPSLRPIIPAWSAAFGGVPWDLVLLTGTSALSAALLGRLMERARRNKTS